MEEREYHYHGKNSDEKSTGGINEIIHDRTITYTPRLGPATEYQRLLIRQVLVL